MLSSRHKIVKLISSSSVFVLLVVAAKLPAQLHGHSDQTPLVAAAATGDIAAVKKLLARKGDFAAVNYPGFDPDDAKIVNQTALIAASKGRHTAVVKLLLEHNADPYARNWVGQTAMTWAKRHRDHKIIGLLQQQMHQFDLNANLIKAAQTGNLKGVQKLLHMGAQPNASWFWMPFGNSRVDYQDTPLIAAAKGGNVDIVQMFLNKGASVDDRNFLSETPLIDAARAGHANVLNLLLDHHAVANARDCETVTALMAASKDGYEDMVKTLLSKNADVNVQSSGIIIGETALSLAQDNAKYASGSKLQSYNHVITLLKAAGGRTFPTHRRIAL